MKRKYLKADLARDLGVKPSLVSRDAKRGMPTHSLAAAREWRRTHLTHQRKDIEPAPAAERVDLGMFTADLLVAAREEMCALLVVESELSLDEANMAISSISVALADALDAMGLDGLQLLFVAGPLSHGPPSEEIAAARARIEARIAAVRIEFAAEDD